MRSLTDLIEAAIDAFEDGQVEDFAHSARWHQIRDGANALISRLLTGGHRLLGVRVDREYQALREALRNVLGAGNGCTLRDDYPLWEAVTEFHLTVKHLERWGDRLTDFAQPSPDAAETRDSWTSSEPPDEDHPLGLPEQDKFDARVVNWDGRRLYLGDDTQVSRLFWLLVRQLGQPCPEAEVQRAVDRMETSEYLGHSDEQIRLARNRVRKAVSKLRKHLSEHGLDRHVVITREGGQRYPSYTMSYRPTRPRRGTREST